MKLKLKLKLNFCRSGLFHMKTRVSLRYFVNDCRLASNTRSSKVLMAEINLSFKLWQNFSKLILVIIWEHRIHIWFHVHLSLINLSQPQSGSCWKSRQGRFLLKLTAWMRELPGLKFWKSFLWATSYYVMESYFSKWCWKYFCRT